MQEIRKKLFFIIGIAIILFSFHQSVFVYAQEEKLFSASLQLQALMHGVIQKVTDALPFSTNKENYKEKYFKLLREFSQLKLTQQELSEGDIAQAIKERFPKSVPVRPIKTAGFGIVYIQTYTGAQIGDMIVDDHLVLVGKVGRITKNFIEVWTLDYPGIEFNVADTAGKFLGVGRTTGLGYIEISLVETKEKIASEDMLVATYGNDKIFPANFLFGRIDRVVRKGYSGSATIEPMANISAASYFVLK